MMDELNVGQPDEPEQPPRLLSAQTKELITSIEALLALVAAIVLLCCIPNPPAFTIQTITVPAHVLPDIRFSAVGHIVPTGKRGMVTPLDEIEAAYNASPSAEAEVGRLYPHGNVQVGPCAGWGQTTGLIVTLFWTCQVVGYTPPPQGTVVCAREIGNMVQLKVKVAITSHRIGWPGK